jgi:son of sevenless-like protein
LRKASPPSIPFLAIVLTDLTFVDEGNSNFLVVDNKELISVEKWNLEADIINQLIAFQKQQNRKFQENEINQKLTSYLLSPPTLSEKQAYQKSLEVEPRE